MRAPGGVLIAVALSFATASVAYAGSVSYVRQVPDRLTPAAAFITYNDPGGDANDLTVLLDGYTGPLTLRDAGALVLPEIPLFAPLSLVDALRYCSFNLTSATCRTWYAGVPIHTTLNLGAGNDRASVGSALTSVNGGSGNDQLTATGATVAHFNGGSGADVMSGGSGPDDSVTYYDYGVGVNISLDGIANDGTANEQDNVMLSIENVDGSAFNDQIVGSAAPNTLRGGDGADLVEGLGGDDRLNVGEGTARGGLGNDELLGNAGSRLEGGEGDDQLGGFNALMYEGGDGNDRILLAGSRSATVDAGAGDDTITRTPGATNNQPVTITCGDGVDAVKALAIDSVAADCEHVTLV